MSIMAQSLEDMAEELTCSICLSYFSTPVSTPCGHNFCSECLELAWATAGGKEYSCPQCRCTFEKKPELMKNTLLSNLVSCIMEAKGESQDTAGDIIVEEEMEEDKYEEEDMVQCDHCMKAPAAKTCMTCMASFCQEHLQPHLESLAFRDHPLSHPIKDLHLRKCMDHGKILDHYCWEHNVCICCYCLAEHKRCKTQSLEDTKTSKELELKKLLHSLMKKISKAASTAEDVGKEEKKVMEVTKKKKELLGGEFEEIKSLIQVEERRAISKIEEEEKKVKNKFNYTHNVLVKKQREFEVFKKRVESVLQVNDELEFLKRAAKLKDTTSKEAYKPKIEFDENLMQTIYKNTTSLKELIKYRLEHPDRDSSLLEKTSNLQMNEFPEWRRHHPASSATPGHEGEFKKHLPQVFAASSIDQKILDLHDQQEAMKVRLAEAQRAHHKYADLSRTSAPTYAKDGFSDGKTGPHGTKKNPETEKHPLKQKTKKTAVGKPQPVVVPAGAIAAVPPAQPAVLPPTREDLLKYAVILTVDINTAHKKVLVSDRNTKLTVCNTNQDYRDNPQRFTHCSQALCTTGFIKGVHYWELEIQGGNFSGIGVAYGSIARVGGESRLGRNKTSWCIEWFNGKLQAWHNDKQTDLPPHNGSKIGVLLNCDEGFVSFFSVAKKFNHIYKFRAKFTEPVYPAFWVFSSSTILHISPFY
uniref:Tripartite motif containing 25 n=1 Tax=Leptobrachium leishanense TaxID=445787 RepID=A0A8C5WMH1_9ANUR